MPWNPLPGDPDRQRRVRARLRPGDRDQQIVAAPRRRSAAARQRGVGDSRTAPAAIALRQSPDAAERTELAPAQKTATPCRVRAAASSPGTISAGADSARSITPLRTSRSRRPQRRQLRVVERIEDPVALRRCRGRSAPPAPSQARRSSAPATSRPRQLVAPRSPAGARTSVDLGRVGAAPADASGQQDDERYRDRDGRSHVRQVHVSSRSIPPGADATPSCAPPTSRSSSPPARTSASTARCAPTQP